MPETEDAAGQTKRETGLNKLNEAFEKADTFAQGLESIGFITGKKDGKPVDGDNIGGNADWLPGNYNWIHDSVAGYLEQNGLMIEDIFQVGKDNGLLLKNFDIKKAAADYHKYSESVNLDGSAAKESRLVPMTEQQRQNHFVHTGASAPDKLYVAKDEYKDDLYAKVGRYNERNGKKSGDDGYLDPAAYLAIKRGIEFGDYTAESLELNAGQFNILKSGGEIRPELLEAFNKADEKLRQQPAEISRSGASHADFDDLPEDEKIKIIMTHIADTRTGRTWTEAEARDILKARANMKTAGEKLDDFMENGEQKTAEQEEVDRRIKELYDQYQK